MGDGYPFTAPAPTRACSLCKGDGEIEEFPPDADERRVTCPRCGGTGEAMTTEAAERPWTNWRGGACPVEPDVVVEWIGELGGGIDLAGALDWGRGSGSWDWITGYRLAEPKAEEPE